MVVKSRIVFFSLSSSYLFLFRKEGVFYTDFRTATRVFSSTLFALYKQEVAGLILAVNVIIAEFATLMTI
jgi:hypothetical protein